MTSLKFPLPFLATALSADVNYEAFFFQFFTPHPQITSVSAYEVWLVFCAVLSFLSFLEYILCIFVGVQRPYAPVTNDAEKPLLSDKEVLQRCHTWSRRHRGT